MASVRPMLGDLELQQVQEIATDGDQVFAHHRVPVLEGDFLQGLGRRGGRITVCGVVSGDGVEERLDGLRTSFRSARPVAFVSDIATATQVDEVLIEELEVRELAGKPKRFEYRLVLREFTEAEPVATEDPPDIPPPELPEEATLIVEVIVEGEPGFDFERVAVSARGTTDEGQALDQPLTDRTGNFWTAEDFPAGSYTVEASVTDDPTLRGAEPAVVRPGETTTVTITLRRGPAAAEAFFIHFRFDSAFVEPCSRPVLREISRRAAANPNEKLLLVGHTDLVGSDAYNQSLSERRARAVYAYLVFGRDPDTAVAEWNTLRQRRPAGELPSLKDTWGTFQVQHMLQDVGFYVGNIDERESDELRQAVRDFQGAHGLPQTGVVDDATWPVLIERYLAVDPQSVAEEKFLPNRGEDCEDGVVKWLGCGEQDPVRNTQDAWRPNRRTEALFVNVPEIPCRVARPVTLDLGAPGARNGQWCLGPGNPNQRCCFLTREREAEGKLLVRPAKPERLTVRGQIRFEDGTPVPFAKYTLIAPDGEFLHTDEAGKPDLGERPAGPDRGRGIPDRADENGFFSYPKPTPVGTYVLEVLELTRPQVARPSEQPPDRARGNVVCLEFDAGPSDATLLASAKAGGPAGDLPAAIVQTEQDVLAQREVVVIEQLAGSLETLPLADAWVHWRVEGEMTLLHTDDDGLLRRLRSGGDETLPSDYTDRFTEQLGKVVDAYYNRAAKPIPAGLIAQNQDLFFQTEVEEPSPTPLTPAPQQPAPAQAMVPQILTALSRPVQLDLWPVLFSLPPATYSTASLSQGATAWNAGRVRAVAAPAVFENDPAPPPPAASRSVERGLMIEGTVDARATGVFIRLLDASGNVVQLRSGSSLVAEVAGTLATTSGSTAGFQAFAFLANAAAALGPVDLAVRTTGQASLQTFPVHLVGCQIAVVNDFPTNANGQVRPTAAPGEAEEIVIADFLVSPQGGGTDPQNLAAITAQTRVRRMVTFTIETGNRPLSANVGAPTVIQPQMPLWMQEMHFVGLSQAELENLMARRYVLAHGPAPGNQVIFVLDLSWRLRMSWDGPDSGSGAAANRIHNYTQDFPLQERVELRFGHRGQFLDSAGNTVAVTAAGEVPGAITPTPTAVAFPVAGRRAPQVVVNGPQRPWGRASGATPRATLIVEGQPGIVNSAGAEIIRGGDCVLELLSLQIDGQRIDPGVQPGNPPSRPPAGSPDVRLPTFRVRGSNPAAADVRTLIDAAVEEFFNANSTQRRVNLLSLAAWQTTLRSIIEHESRGLQHFDFRFNGAARFNNNNVERFGFEFGMPIFGPPHGYGLAQIDNLGLDVPAGQVRGPNNDEVWSFLQNVRTAVRLAMEEKARFALIDFTSGAPAGGEAAFDALGTGSAADQRRQRAMFRRQVVRRYNGGREFRFELFAGSQEWVIRTTATGRNLAYPNAVLRTTINYPTQRDFPEAQFGPGI